MTTNQNAAQKVDSHCFKLHRSYLTSFNLSNVGEIFWVESERKKKKKIFVLCPPCSTERASEIRKFSCRSLATRAKKYTKKRDARAKLFCYKTKPTAFLLLRKLPLVVIQKFCYHSNVTSHFSSLFLSELNSNKTLWSVQNISLMTSFAHGKRI